MVCCDIDASIIISFGIKTNDRSHKSTLNYQINAMFSQIFSNLISNLWFYSDWMNNVYHHHENNFSLLQWFTSAISRSKLTEEQNNSQNCEIMLPIIILLRLKMTQSGNWRQKKELGEQWLLAGCLKSHP